MRKILLLLSIISLLLCGTSCLNNSNNSNKQNTESVKKESIAVHTGLPKWLGGKGMLYVDTVEAQDQISAKQMSPIEYLIYKMGRWFTLLTFASAIGMICGIILIYLNTSYFKGLLPFGKDIILLSAIIFVSSLGVIFFLNYIYWIAAFTLLCILAYAGWTLWRIKKTYDSKVKSEQQVQTKDKVIQELVKTGEVLKNTTKWTDEEKKLINSIQSDETMNHVKQIKQLLVK
jgi:cell division protein FtsB